MLRQCHNDLLEVPPDTLRNTRPAIVWRKTIPRFDSKCADVWNAVSPIKIAGSTSKNSISASKCSQRFSGGYKEKTQVFFATKKTSTNVVTRLISLVRCIPSFTYFAKQNKGSIAQIFSLCAQLIRFVFPACCAT